MAHLIAIALLIGIAMGAQSRRLIQIAVAWSTVTLAGIAYNYNQSANDRLLVVEPSLLARIDRALEMYLSAAPIQFAFNALVFLVLPALLVLGVKRFTSRREAVGSNQPTE